MSQLPLDFTPRTSRETEIDERARAFDLANPDVYYHFARLARRARDAGFERYSARAIFNAIRWHIEVETRGAAFKVNNYFTPYYARKLMREDPSFEGFFETRDRRHGSSSARVGADA